MHVFTVVIFQSETIQRDYLKLRLCCIIIIIIFILLLFRNIFFLSRVYRSYALQSVHHAVAMQCPSVVLSGFDPKRVQSHLLRGTCTGQFVLVCGNGQWIRSTVANAIVSSWLRSTAPGSCLLSYTSVTLLKLLIIDPTNSDTKISYDRLQAIIEFSSTNVACWNRVTNN